MKINDLTSLGNIVKSGAPMEAKAAQSGSAPSFRAAMQGVNQQNAEQYLNDLHSRIQQQGAVLGQRYDILELKRYKELITEYLNEAVRFMYEFKKQSTFDARGRHRLYSTIKRINDKLEEMTREVLGEQGDNITLLAAIDDIRGMLVDILL